MRIPNDIWQGCSGYWQNRFIHHHMLILGSTAWIGYINEGRGMVICEVVDAIAPTIDWMVDTVSFDQQYIPQGQIGQYQQALKLENDAITALLGAIATYDPTQAMAIAIIGNGAIEINLLHHLKISPRDCYNQVQRRWAEFQLDSNTPRRH
jgi:hypothetical protein